MNPEVELELDILAAVMHDGRLAVQLFRLLERDDFISPQGRVLYDAVGGVAKRDGVGAIDATTIRDELHRAGNDPRQVLALMDAARDLGVIGSFEAKCRRLRDLRRSRILEQGVTRVHDLSDPEEKLNAVMEVFEEARRLVLREAVSLTDLISLLLDERERELEAESRIKLGLPQVDRYLSGGLASRWFAVIGARTGVGKTMLAIQTTWHALRAGHRVLYISLEEGATDVVERVIRHGRRVPRTGGPGDPLFAAAMDDEIHKLPLFITSEGELTGIVSAIHERCIQAEGLGLVVVDYIGLVRVRRAENRVQEVSEITRTLKQVAMDTGVPILGLAQINRAPMARKDHRPNLSDLRDSGSIEQDADVVMLLHRDGEVIGSGGQISLAKNRYGPPAVVPIRFNYTIGHITEVKDEPFG